jgi:rifampicin phosphotransferase
MPKQTQIKNDDNSDTMRGFAVSSGRVTAPASVITGPADFDKMAPGSILVSPRCWVVGNGTKRIAHGQMITIDGDAGTVEIHQQIDESA